MGVGIDEVFSGGHDGDQYGIVLVTNQDDGIASYARGIATFRPQRFSFDINRPYNLPARLSTAGSAGLEYFFSDRIMWNQKPSGGPFPIYEDQPFSTEATDQLGFSITQPLWGPLTVKFTLLSWGNATFSISVAKQGKLLFGMGPGIGPGVQEAGYLIAITGKIPPVL